MRQKCIQAVTQAAIAGGRKAPTKAQLDDIEARMSRARTMMAREDHAKFAAMTEAQRLQEAGRIAMEDIQAEAANKLRQAQLQIQRTAETAARVNDLQASMQDSAGLAGTRAEAVSRDVRNTDRMVFALRKDTMGKMLDLIQAAGDKMGAGVGRRILMTVFDAENPVMTRDIVREVFKNGDGHTSNKPAQAAARAWLDGIEELRQRFNAAGGDVGRLDYGYTPQPHDTVRIRKAGADAWVNKTMPLLDRTRYLLDDGSRMSDDQLRDVLKGVYETLKSEGVNNMTPGEFHGSGKRANRHGDSRQIHFADGDAWLSYMADFGRGSIFDAMMSHVGGMARDITLVERYGPDVTAQSRVLLDEARKLDGKAASETLTGWGTVDPSTYFKMVMGQVGTPASEPLARTASMVRNLQTAAKLGGAVISSITDLGTMMVTMNYHGLPYWQLLKDIARQGTAETRDFMAAHGMIAESVSDALNKWSGDHIGTNWSGKMANSVMRWSFMNAWTDGMRQGFTLTMNQGLARMAKKGWSALDATDQARLRRAGITEQDWSTLQTVAPTIYRGRELLTPDAIRSAGDAALAQKVFGFIIDESEYAVVNPDMTARAFVTWGGLQSGTPAGEFARTVMQFKSFPAAMVTRHWRRMLEGAPGESASRVAMNRTQYGFALMLSTTILGALAVQAKQMLAGKDPIDMSQPKFWPKAVTQGGGLSILGDLFLVDPASNPGDQMGNLAKNMAGPTFGTATELGLKVISENIWQAADGKDTHWEAELFQWSRSNTPANNLWWLKPAVDHSFANAVAENLSPGYLNRMRQRAQKDWKQQYFWAPQDATPQRPPDLAGAFGR